MPEQKMTTAMTGNTTKWRSEGYAINFIYNYIIKVGQINILGNGGFC